MAGAAHVSGRPQSVRLGSVAVKRINRERRNDLPPLSSESRAPSGHIRLLIQCRSDLYPTYKTSWSADSRKSFIRATVPFVVITLSMTAHSAGGWIYRSSRATVVT
jgi:hypothetical protein